jgi:hypothetical protein
VVTTFCRNIFLPSSYVNHFKGTYQKIVSANAGDHLQDHRALQPTRPPSTSCCNENFKSQIPEYEPLMFYDQQLLKMGQRSTM